MSRARRPLRPHSESPITCRYQYWRGQRANAASAVGVVATSRGRGGRNESTRSTKAVVAGVAGASRGSTGDAQALPAPRNRLAGSIDTDAPSGNVTRTVSVPRAAEPIASRPIVSQIRCPQSGEQRGSILRSFGCDLPSRRTRSSSARVQAT